VFVLLVPKLQGDNVVKIGTVAKGLILIGLNEIEFDFFFFYYYYTIITRFSMPLGFWMFLKSLAWEGAKQGKRGVCHG
jgi:hypothetical protein